MWDIEPYSWSVNWKKGGEVDLKRKRLTLTLRRSN